MGAFDFLWGGALFLTGILLGIIALITKSEGSFAWGFIGGVTAFGGLYAARHLKDFKRYYNGTP